MFKILDRYIAKTIMSATGVAAAFITAVLFIMALLTEFKDIGEGDYGFGSAVIYVLMRLPNAIYQFSPVLILLGSIIGLSILSSGRELSVMRASGYSIRNIIRSVLISAFILIAFISIVGELIGPSFSHKAEMGKDNLQNAGQAVATASGVWLHVDNNFVHINRVVGKQLLEGVTRYKFDDQHQLQEAYYANTMSADGAGWLMHHVVKTTISKNRARSESFPTLRWDLEFNKSLLDTGRIEPDELTLGKLNKFANYLDENGIQSVQYRFEFWERIFTPLASLVMIFLAIPFVLGALRNMAMGMRLVIGILVGFTFFILNAFLAQLCIVYQVPPAFAAFLPILIFALIGLILAKKLITS